MEILYDLEDGNAPEGGRGLFVINTMQLVHVKIMLNELRGRREDNGLDTHDIDELLDTLPDLLI